MKEQHTNTPPRDLGSRTKAFALRVIRVCDALPSVGAGRVIGQQLLKSGTSVGAHYREATRARSTAEFVSKIEGGQQELEEAIYWLELVAEADLLPAAKLSEITTEANELMAVLATCARNAKSKIQRKAVR